MSASFDALEYDALEYFENLKAAGVPEAQAKVQPDTLRKAIEKYDENSRKELATKADLKDLELRLIKWQIGGMVALGAIMAKGFGWLGF